jgi:hypothetical protein
LKKFAFIPWIVFCGIFYLGSTVQAQSAQRDSTVRQDAVRVDSTDNDSGEMILDEIEIRGKVEKPGVIVMPKRVEPELGEVELTRSFKKEMKEGVGEIPKPEKELGRVDRVKSIKKTVERKRK